MRPIVRQHILGEIVQSKGSSSLKNAISEAVKAGDLKKLVSNIYTTSTSEEPATVLKRNLYVILGMLFPGAVISHRSAIEAGPKDENIVITYGYSKKIKLPGMTVHLMEGPGPLDNDMPFAGGMHLASPERSWLENLRPTKAHGFRKTLTQESLEFQLDEYIRVHGEVDFRERINYAHKLGTLSAFSEEIEPFQKLAGALLGTRTHNTLITERGKSRSTGLPFDPERIQRFEKLFEALMKMENLPSLMNRETLISSASALVNFCFFDSYFSNYIEGTRFEVEQARQIVYEGQIPEKRPESHDVIGTFQMLQLVSRKEEKNWEVVEELIADLKKFHTQIMKAHPDKRPGQFKERRNFAGSTEFVAPNYVGGTFKKGFELYKALPKGFQRAIYVKFMVAEIHPFDDGNGRLSRIVMNREFHRAEQIPIIIPTVFRTDYLGAIKKLTRTNDPAVFLKMLRRAQAFTASLDFSSYEAALSGLSRARAFSDDPEDTLLF
ncbi:MAG: cell filamentation protein Fic [Sphingobacteriales bacterium]|nr:MAG: cell filamentation protein Fic [Sphingobacteriales bacterium]